MADGSIVIDTRLDNSGFQRGSEKMQNATRGLTNSINQMGRGASAAVQAATPAIQQMGQAVQQMQQQINGTRFQDFMGASAFDSAMAGTQRQVNSLAGSIQKLHDAEKMGVTTGSQQKRFALNYDKAQAQLTALQQKLEQFANTPVNTSQYDVLQAEWEKLNATLDKLYQKQDMMQSMGVKENSAKWTNLAAQIEYVGQQLDAVADKQRALRTEGTSSMLGGDTVQYQQMTAQLQQMQQELAQYQQMASQVGQTGGEMSYAQAALHGFGQGLQMIGSTAARAAKGLASLAFHGIAAGARAAASGVKTLAGGLKSLFSHSKRASSGNKGLLKSLLSVKTMLLSRIRRTFISSIFNGLKEGMTSFAKYSSEFNASMSAIKNSMKGASGNVSVFAANLVNAIAPALSAIIDWASRAIAILNALFALLSGRGTFSVAKKGTDDYAKSLKGAGGAAKDLKNQVYGFDELNKEDDKSGGGGGGGGGGVDFEEQTIASVLPEELLNAVQAIKDAFNAGEFEKVGELAAQGLNGIITSVDGWINDTLRPAAVQWTSNIARILNGFVAGLDWNNLGKLVADGLNLVFDVVNTALTTFNWDMLGVQFGNGINGIVNNFDWSLAGQTVANGTNAIWGVLYGAFTTLDWSTLASNFATGLNSLYQSVNWAQLGSAIGTGIMGIWTIIVGTIAEFDWISLGEGFATSVNSIFESIDWAAAGEMLSTGLIGIVDGITAFIAETDWQMIGNDIATFLAAIDWSGLVSSIMTGIGAALAGIAELIWGLIETAWNDVVTWWNETAYDDGGFTIEGLLNGILAAIAGIGAWIQTNIFQPFIDGFKSVFGIASPSTVMEEQGGYIIEGLLQGITNVWETVTEWFTTALESITTLLSDAWTSIQTTATELWTDISGAITGAWDTVASTAADVWNGVSTAVTDAWDTVSTTAATVWDGVSTAITGAWGTVSNTAESVWNSVSSAVTGAWDTVSSTAADVWDGVSTAVTDAWDTVSGTAESVWSGVSTAITTAWDTVSSTAESVWSGISTAITTAWDTVASTAADVWNGISTAITTAWDTVASTAADVWNGISTAITGAWDTVSTKVSEVWDGVATTVTGAWDSVSSKATEVWNGVTTDITTAWNDVTTAASTTWSDVKTTVISWFTGARDDAQAVDWSSVGKQIPNGTESGFNSIWSSFKTRITNKFSSLVSGVKSLLGIHSPSRVFAGIGEYMMQGLVNGVEDEQNTVDRTMANVSKAVTEGMSAEPTLEVGMESTVNGLDQVTTRLSNIAQIFVAISNALSTMGGLSLPAVASGAFTPYRARVGIGGGLQDDSETMSNFTRNFDETMSDQRDVLREILDVLRQKDFTIDAYGLERLLSLLRSDRERAFGGA